MCKRKPHVVLPNPSSPFFLEKLGLNLSESVPPSETLNYRPLQMTSHLQPSDSVALFHLERGTK